ncbi:MAG: gamma carbonic anhydrase family protein [Acidimicrobiia bacterium]|nr:gamma carbonic anhydrase family protein [Acidimicrobiia bacterium]
MIRPFKGVTPTIDASAYVDESAQVIGDVQIGAESSVWMNVVLRGDVNHIRIGKRTNIQDLTMVHVMRDTHPTLIGDDVTVGHSAVVHGTTIEDRVLIGMGAVLLNGVHIEPDCVIAAGTLITEGTRIPARSLVMGRPGTVRRQLTDEEVAEIRWYADNYVAYRLDYAGSEKVEERSEK